MLILDWLVLNCIFGQIEIDFASKQKTES